MIPMVLMAYYLTANDAFGFAQKGNSPFHVQAMKGLSNQALHGDAVNRSRERHR